MLAQIPKDIILVWPGSHATIPSDWTRETSFDDKFVKGWGSANPDTTGGATTHTHTSPNHSHTLNAHTHTYSLTSAGITIYGMDPAHDDEAIIDTHTHLGTSGDRSGGTTSSDAVTYGAVSNNPPHRKVIFIKAGVRSLLSTDITAFYNSNTPPANWSNVTELQGRYLKGAAAGADSDLTTNNGSTTNSHNISHNHTAQSHTHVAANSAVSSDQSGGENTENAVLDSHVHSVTLGAGTQALNANADTLVTTETVEPLYKTLQAIKKGSTGALVLGLIGLWLGSEVTIPTGWHACNGNDGTPNMADYHLKIGDPADGTGGSNTHTHAVQAHGHTSNGTHSHSGAASAHVNYNNIRVGASATTHRTMENSVHPVASVSSPSTIYANANTTANSSNNEPEYRVAIFIQLIKFTNKSRILEI